MYFTMLSKQLSLKKKRFQNCGPKFIICFHHYDNRYEIFGALGSFWKYQTKIEHGFGRISRFVLSLSVFLSVCLSVCLSVYLSLCLYLCVSLCVCLSLVLEHCLPLDEAIESFAVYFCSFL